MSRSSRLSSRLADWSVLALPGIIWGASFLFIAEGLQAVAPMGVTFVRIAVGFATLSLFPGVRRPVARADWLAIAALGLLWMAFPQSMFPFAEQHVSSALTGMLNGATPLFAAIVSSLLARRAPSRAILIGLIVGLTGAVLIALPGLGEGNSAPFGVFLILVALCSYGVAFNLARPLQQRHGSLPVVWRALGVALVLTAPFGVPALTAAHWSLRAALCLLALGALGTGVAFILFATATGRVGPTRASGTLFLTPVVALFLGVAIRHEQVSLISILGGAVCLLGAWLLGRTSPHRVKDAAVPVKNAA